DGERIVVCHSLACTLWLRMGAGSVDRLALVAPPADDVLRNGVAPAFVAARVTPVAEARETVVVCSDDDPYNPAGPGPLAETLGADLHVIPGAGHITPDDGYGPFPWLEAWCLR